MSSNSSSDFRVNTYISGRQENPDIAIGSLGNFVITWQSDNQDGDEFGVFARLYNSSASPLGTDFRVNTTTTGDQADPAVAMDADGDFVITWVSDQQGTADDIYGQRYNSSGQPIGTEFRVNLGTLGDQNNPDVATDGIGNFVVVYESDQQYANTAGQDNDGTGIFGQRFDRNGAIVGTEFRINTQTDNDQTDPTVAMNSQGEFVVVWVSEGQNNGGRGIFGQRYNNAGGTIGAEFQVNTQTNGSQLNPSVAIDDTGGFVVAWQSDSDDGDDDDGYGVYARRFSNIGNPLGDEFLVNQTTDGNQVDPAVATDANGNFTVVWASDQDNNDFAIFGQRFNSNGQRNGNEFEISNQNDGDQTTPAIGLTPTSDYVVAWASNDDGEKDILAESTVAKQVIKGTKKDDVLKGTSDGDRIKGLQGDDVLQGLNGNDILEGGSGDDDLQGGNNDDTLSGGDNNDKLDGGGGNDALTGNGGSDTFVLRPEPGNTVVTDFENGKDILGLSAGIEPKDIRLEQQGDNTAIIWQGLELAVLLGIDVQQIAPADFKKASRSGKEINGTASANNLTGTNGGDEINGRQGDDVLSGRAGDDTLDGGRGNDKLYGEADNDVLYGGNDNDQLDGGDGEDFLIAGNGNDKLTGGKNSDIFFLQIKNGTTVIKDFQDGIDFLVLDDGLDPSLLKFVQQGANTVINLGDQQLAVLKNINAGQITYAPSDFL